MDPDARAWRDPGDANLTTDLGAAVAALEQARFGDILPALERAASADVPDAWHWQRVAEIAGRIGDDDSAVTAVRRLVALAPRDLRRRIALRELLGGNGAVREALTLARKLEQEVPDDPLLRVGSAVLEGRLGREEEALRTLRSALRRAPQLLIGWEILASLKTFRGGDDPERQQLEQLVARSSDRPETAGIVYALAKACDDAGDVDRAFELFMRGSQRILGKRQPRTDSFYQEAADLRAAFPADRIATAGGRDRPDRPILVLGCPRSGTTLLERILVTDPQAHSGGELKYLRLACLGFTPPAPARVDAFVQSAGGEARAWQTLADTYVRKLVGRFGTADGVVDKALVNYLYVGALALGLPRARFIHVRRDPMDVAWSCFRRRFHEGLAWSYHFDSIAAFLRVHQDTMDHWAEALPSRLLVLDYEKLVAEPDAETARVFAFAGLTRPDDWRAFHARKGTIITASQLQVRRPLNAAGVGAWRRYGKHLGPLREALIRHGVRDVATG